MQKYNGEPEGELLFEAVLAAVNHDAVAEDRPAGLRISEANLDDAINTLEEENFLWYPEPMNDGDPSVIHVFAPKNN